MLAYTSYDGQKQVIMIAKIGKDGKPIGNPYPISNPDSIKQKDSYPSWSPNGKYIVFERRGKNSCKLYIVRVETKKEYLFYAGDKRSNIIHFPRHPCWSLSLKNKKIFFICQNNLASIHIDDTFFDSSYKKYSKKHPLEYITKDSYVCYDYPVCSFNGKKILFQSAGLIKEMSLSDKSIKTFDKIKEYVFNPSWGHKGDKILFVRSNKDKNYDIWILDKKSQRQSLKQITNDKSKEKFPRWSADGKKIAFSSNRDNQYSIWILVLD
jgi:Tol biopolymer transport system component